MKFSIIVPCMSINQERDVKDCIKACFDINNKDFEFILLPDEDIKEKIAKIRVIPTGKIRPSEKRNLGVKEAKGEILVFLDDDAYPQKDWLDNVSKYFKNNKIGIVGGPNLTPKDSSFLSKCGGDVLANWLTGLSSVRYKIVNKPIKVLELPACNLFVRKDLFKKVGGFDPSLLTAEDSKLCFNIRNLKKQVLYVPDVIVYHYRRELFKPHMKQMWIYARDKAWLIKEDFSIDKLYYSILSWFVLFLLIGAIISIFTWFKYLYLFFVLFYLYLVFFSSLLTKIERSLFVFLGLILTHIIYGTGFIYGIIRKKHPTLYGQMW